VECSLYSWPIAGSDRRAVVLADGLERVVTSPSGAPIPTATAIGAWLHEPDPAVLRAGVVPGLIADLAGTASVDASSSWLTGDLPPKFDAAVRSYRVVSEVTGSTKEQRRILAAHGVSSLTVKSRDVDVDPRKVLARLGIPEGSGHVLVLTRRAGRLLSLLTDPAVPRSG
jgi:hypothetical protein